MLLGRFDQSIPPLLNRRSVSKFFRESEDFTGNRETVGTFWETQSINEVKISGKMRFWGEFLPNIWDDIPDFPEDFQLHTVL